MRTKANESEGLASIRMNNKYELQQYPYPRLKNLGVKIRCLKRPSYFCFWSSYLP